MTMVSVGTLKGEYMSVCENTYLQLKDDVYNEFVDEVKRRFPHWEDMHNWLEWKDPCIWPYLGVKAPDIYNKWHNMFVGS